MSQEEETTKSGAPIYRHQERESGRQAPSDEGRNLEAIDRHVQQHIGEVATVLHEIASDLVHVDVLYVAATPERPYQVFVTSGMSDLAMTTPEGVESFDRAELLIVLPESWPVTSESVHDENWYWPIRWLKYVARLPHQYKTWIGWGHTIPNGDPPESIANTGFVGVMASLPYWLSEDFHQLKADSGDTVRFYHLVPLYREEMELKLDLGAEELEERMDKAKIGFAIDTGRPNVAKRKRWFSRK